MDITEQTAESLAAKLEGLDLDGPERALLDAIIDAAFDDEVAGFALSAGYGPKITALIGDDFGVAVKGLIGDDFGVAVKGDRSQPYRLQGGR